MYLEFTLKGERVSPDIKVSPDEGTMDYGHVMSGDKCTKVLQLFNPSKLAVKYCLTQASSKICDQKCE